MYDLYNNDNYYYYFLSLPFVYCPSLFPVFLPVSSHLFPFLFLQFPSHPASVNRDKESGGALCSLSSLSGSGQNTAENVFRVLPRIAMHKRGLCRRTVSVCLSVTFVYFVETNKYKISSVCSPSCSRTILAFFHIKLCGNIPMGTPPPYSLTRAKIAIFDQYLALALMTAGPSSVVKISTVHGVRL